MSPDTMLDTIMDAAADVTPEQIQVTVYYTSLDPDGAATAAEVRTVLAEAGLDVRAGESLAQWRFDRGGVSYRPRVGFGFGGPAHADLIVVVLDWLTNHLLQAAAGIFLAEVLRGAGKKAGEDGWNALKGGILALKQHQWGRRAPRAAWVILPVPTSEGVRWLGLRLPALAEDLSEPLAKLSAVQLPAPQPGHAITWLDWDSDQGLWA